MARRRARRGEARRGGRQPPVHWEVPLIPNEADKNLTATFKTKRIGGGLWGGRAGRTCCGRQGGAEGWAADQDGGVGRIADRPGSHSPDRSGAAGQVNEIQIAPVSRPRNQLNLGLNPTNRARVVFRPRTTPRTLDSTSVGTGATDTTGGRWRWAFG